MSKMMKITEARKRLAKEQKYKGFLIKTRKKDDYHPLLGLQNYYVSEIFEEGKSYMEVIGVYTEAASIREAKIEIDEILENRERILRREGDTRFAIVTEARKKLAAEGSGKLGKGSYKKSEVMAYLDENNIEWEADPFKPLKIKIRYSDYLLHKTFLQRYLVELFLGNAYIQQN